MAQHGMLSLLWPMPLAAGLVVLGAVGLGMAAACFSDMFKGRYHMTGLGSGKRFGDGIEPAGQSPANNFKAQNSSSEHVEIEPMKEDFNWQSTAPLKLRPFKPTYFITMALRTSTPSDLIIMDSNYIERIQTRTQVIRDHAEHVLGCIPGPPVPPLHPTKADEEARARHQELYNGSVGGVEAVRELYAYLLGEYLPKRYPTLFALEDEPASSSSSSGKKKTFHNKITGAKFPSELPPLSPTDTQAAIEALKILGETVEDDLTLLQQDASPLPDNTLGTTTTGGGKDGAGLHRLVATIVCNPSGFDPAEKMGKVLRDIHAPVPSYEKIEKSMERFFSRAEVGKSSSRINWSITTNPVLYNLASNHIKEGQKIEEDEEIDVSKAFLRCELQTVTRVPGRSRAILFSFKSFMYPISELREEGIGPELADAIEGLKTGNAPGMWVYKGAVRWAKPVCEYLRS